MCEELYITTCPCHSAAITSPLHFKILLQVPQYKPELSNITEDKRIECVCNGGGGRGE